MMSLLTSLVLRFYPPAWRLRYEDEVRALLADNPPGLRDIASLARAGVVERWFDVIDPVAHPVLAGFILGLGGWVVVGSVIAASASLVAGFAERSLGSAPAWVAFASGIGIFATYLRAFVAQPNLFRDGSLRVAGRPVRVGPLSRVEATCCWVVLWLAVTTGRWAHFPLVNADWLPPFWFLTPLLLSMSTEAGWARARARSALQRLKGELNDVVREHHRLSHLAVKGLATAEEGSTILREIDRINHEVRQASREYRRAQVRQLPAERPLGL